MTGIIKRDLVILLEMVDIPFKSMDDDQKNAFMRVCSFIEDIKTEVIFEFPGERYDRKIQTIKKLREIFNFGLAEAREISEQKRCKIATKFTVDYLKQEFLGLPVNIYEKES